MHIKNTIRYIDCIPLFLCYSIIICQLFKLSYLLGLSTESDSSLHSMSTWTKLSSGRGHTAIYIALSALQVADYKSAQKLCSILINCAFSDAWEVCK